VKEKTEKGAFKTGIF